MLLGRRSSDRAYDRNALRFVEGRAVAWNALCDTPSGKRRGDRLAAVLQSPEAAFDAGISQPDGLREKVACRQREARRIIAQLWETPNAGKVSSRPTTARFIADFQPSFGQRTLDVAIAQGKAKIEPDGMSDD